MTDFSLSHPTTKSGRDANVFAPQPGRDYSIVAETAWVETQLLALDVTEADTELRSVAQRLQAALLWFKEHGKTNPQYDVAKRLQADLDARLDTLLLHLRVVLGACWWQCMTTFAALCHITDRATWLSEVAGSRFDGTSPQGIWHAVLPGRKPPGSWPMEAADQIIERRMNWTETWGLEDQAILLSRKQKQAAYVR